MEAVLKRPDGCELFYIVDDFTDPWRPAQTVLLVHGLAESTEAWRAWVPHFSGQYRVVRVDLRGFGRSTPMPDEFECARQTMQGRLGSKVSQAEMDWWVDTIQSRTPVSTMMGYLRWVPSMDIRGDVSRITCPTLIINTTGSSMRAADSYNEWQPRIRDSRLVTVEGDAWHAAGAYPDRCAHETLKFIQSKR